MKHSLLAAAAACLAGSVLAAGFGLNEESVRGNAMQGSLVGSTKDVSAVYYNPANMTELSDGSHIMAGLTFARPDYNVKVADTKTDQNEHIFELPHFFYAANFTDDLFFGIGEYTEYGLGTHYESLTWPLAADSTKTAMYQLTVSPTLAYKVTDDLSIGAGIRVMWLQLISDRMLPAYGSHFHLDVDDWAISYLASVAYQLTDTIRIGVVYRAEADFEEEGDVELYPLGMTTGVKGDIEMPKSVMIGLNWEATDKLEFGINATWNNWSCIKSLDMDFESPAIPDQVCPQNWHDTWRYSAGAEYKIDKNWAVQCGYTFDTDPTDAGYANTLCPPGDRNQYGLGFTYGQDNWKIGADYMFVHIRNTDREIHGVETHFRDLKTDTLALNFSYDF